MNQFSFILLKIITVFVCSITTISCQNYKYVDYLTQQEKRIFKELNIARTNPNLYKKKMEKLVLEYEKTGTESAIFGREGVQVVIETIAYLDTVTAVPEVEVSQALSHAAFDHIKDIARLHKIRHTGTDGSQPRDRIKRYDKWGHGYSEIISDGPNEADWIIMGYIIDADVPDRGHRLAIYHGNFKFAGLSYIGRRSVIDFAYQIEDHPILAQYLGNTLDPIEAEYSYNQTIELVHMKRDMLYKQFIFTKSINRKMELLKRAEFTFEQSLLDHLNRYWSNNPPFTKNTNIPNEVIPACSYYITTLFYDAGFSVKRNILYYESPRRIIRQFVSPENIRVFRNITYDSLENRMQDWGNGIYLLGTHDHIALVNVNSPNFIVVFHGERSESGFRFSFYQGEKAFGKSKYYVIGKLSGDMKLLMRWLYDG